MGIKGKEGRCTLSICLIQYACFYIFKGEKFGEGGGGALENKPHVLNKRISPNRAAIIEVLFSCFFVILKVFMEAKSIKLNHPLSKLRKLCT